MKSNYYRISGLFKANVVFLPNWFTSVESSAGGSTKGWYMKQQQNLLKTYYKKDTK